MIHLAEDTINSQDIDRLVAWLKTYPRLTQGKVVKEFESKWSEWLDVPYSVFCNSGSSANLLMYATLLYSGKLKNNKIIVPSTGWSTSISPAIQLGFEPIMCETDPDTWGLDLDCLEKLLKKNHAAAVFLVHVLGIPHKMTRMMELEEKYDFYLLEDCCAAIGSETLGKKVGTFGDMSSFSFYFGHQMSTIEGGMVCTYDKKLYELLIQLRSHGWDKDLVGGTDFNFCEPGFNLRSTDLNAFIGLGQLRRLNQISKTRHSNHVKYHNLLSSRFMVQQLGALDTIISSIHFAIVAKESNPFCYNPSLERDTIVKALKSNKIETRRFTAANIGRHPFWIKGFGLASFPVADRLYNCGLFLPNHPSMTSEDVERVAQCVLSSVR